MGLALTIDRNKNHMGIDFINAYWKIDDVRYGMDVMTVSLCAYPTRDASILSMNIIPERFEIGGPVESIYRPIIYRWEGEARISDVFPNGIPLDADEQKTAVYNWIKAYTGLPFEDVFE